MEKTKGKKRLSTHLQILHVSKNLFEQNGVSNTTIDDIAADSGIARSTFFTHFASLDELYAELADREAEDLLETINALQESDLPPDKLLKGLFSKLVDDTTKYPKTFVELLIKGLLFKKAPIQYFIKLEEVISAHLVYAHPPLNDNLTIHEMYATLTGLYFGLIYCNLLRGENISDIQAIKNCINKYIDSLDIKK
ncbi:MAG: TetR/AcrR family transcriptional regulator [Clostridiales bacterium]|jgi:AcrR family transcriptional regulator|nr:TetR/AcrR family transcriptional regulator [Clostridiales bacterium]